MSPSTECDTITFLAVLLPLVPIKPKNFPLEKDNLCAPGTEFAFDGVPIDSYPAFNLYGKLVRNDQLIPSGLVYALAVEVIAAPLDT